MVLLLCAVYINKLFGCSEVNKTLCSVESWAKQTCPGTCEDFTRGPVTGAVPGAVMNPRASRADLAGLTSPTLKEAGMHDTDQ